MHRYRGVLYISFRLGLKLTKHIAMDCEMVGIGYQGKDHMLARISIVNQQGDIIMDKYVKPTESVSILHNTTNI